MRVIMANEKTKEELFEINRKNSIEHITKMILHDEKNDLIILSVNGNNDGSISIMTGKSVDDQHVYVHTFKSLKMPNPLRSNIITGGVPLTDINGKAL
jgi:hypothetical protein